MITLGNYMDFKAAGENEINQMTALTGLPKQAVEQMSLADVRSTIASFLEELNGTKADKLFREVTINGRAYGFHPNLEGMTFKEFIDLDMLLQDFHKNIAKVMSIIYRPIIAKWGDRYEIEPYNSDVHILRADDLREMPLAAVNGAMVFFCQLRNDLLLTFQKSLEMEMLEQTEEMMEEIQISLHQQA
jgi:hypothetical protein